MTAKTLGLRTARRLHARGGSAQTKGLSVSREPVKIEFPGDVLLSHAVYREVPSGLKGLTAVFGMGTGVAPSLKPPGKLVLQKSCSDRGAQVFAWTIRSLFQESRCVRNDSHLRNFMVKPHGRLVRVSFTPCSASTPRLSTWSSPTGL